MKKILIILLSIVFVISSFSMIGCSKDDSSNDENQSITGGTFEESETSLVANGSSKYSIVIPQNAEYFEEFAANELKDIFAMSTGVSLDIIRDSANMTLDGYYYSVGNTTLKEKAGTTVSITNKEFAYKIERKENTLILCGVDAYGTTFATYEYLEKQFGYKYFAADEIYVDEVTNANLLDMNFEYAPYLPRQRVSAAMSTPESSARLYSVKPNFSLYWPHSHFAIAPPKTYQKEHPDWYDVKTPTGTAGALCLTNTELQTQMAINLIAELDAREEYNSVLIGQEDSWARCKCPTCNASNEKYTMSGTNVVFINNIAKEMKRIYTEQGRPNQEFELVLLAYYQNELPPVEKNANGDWIPVHKDVMLDEHVAVQICLLYSDASAEFEAPKNAQTVKDFQGWIALGAKAVESYIYRGYFVMQQMMFYNDWGYMQDWIKGLGKYGTRQGTFDSVKPYTFFDLRAYVMTQLCYDVTQDVNVLIKEFIEHYYKDAAPYVQAYFDGITTHMNMRKEYYNSINGDFGMYCLVSQHTNLYKTENWPELALRQWADLLEQGKQAINDGDYTEKEKEVLLARVGEVALNPNYWLLKFYGSNFTSEEYNRRKEEVLTEAYQVGYSSDQVYLA